MASADNPNGSTSAGHEDGQSGSGGQSNQQGGGQKPRSNYKDVLIELVLIAVGSGFFSLFNDFLEFFGVHGSKPLCVLAGMICVEFAVVHWFFKNRREHARLATWIFIAVVVVEAIAVCRVMFFSPRRHPHLNLKLLTSEYPYSRVLIPIESHSRTDLNCVVIPVNSETNDFVVVQFLLCNDSDETLDLVEAQMNLFGDNPLVIPRDDGMRWLMVLPSNPTNPPMFGFKIPTSMLPKDADRLPPLVFKIDKMDSLTCLVTLAVSSRQHPFPRQIWQFDLRVLGQWYQWPNRPQIMRARHFPEALKSNALVSWTNMMESRLKYPNSPGKVLISPTNFIPNPQR